jgi:hypothetical protein
MCTRHPFSVSPFYRVARQSIDFAISLTTYKQYNIDGRKKQVILVHKGENENGLPLVFRIRSNRGMLKNVHYNRGKQRLFSVSRSRRRI